MHLALAGWIVIAAVAVPPLWRHPASGEAAGETANAIAAATWTGTLFLLLTAAMHAWQGWRMRYWPAATGSGLGFLAGDTLVLAVVAKIAFSSLKSPLYLAGLDGLIAALASAALASAGLIVASHYGRAKADAANTARGRRAMVIYWTLWIVHLLAAFAVVAVWLSG